MSKMKFARDFVSKIVCVDPLDRKIVRGYDPEDEDQQVSDLENDATTIQEFKELVSKLEPLDGKLLSNPLSGIAFNKLDKLFQKSVQ